MPCNVPRDLEQRARYRSPALEDRRMRMQANERKTFFLSHEDRIRHATVGLIPQEGRRQNRGAELFCRNLQRKREIEGERGREREDREGCGGGGESRGYTSSGTPGPRDQESAPIVRARGRKDGGERRLEIERNHEGWRSVWYGGGDKFLR